MQSNKNKPKKSVSAIVNYYYNAHNKKSLDKKTHHEVASIIKMLSGTNFLLMKYENTQHFYNVVLPGLTYTYFTHNINYTNLSKFLKLKSDQIIFCQILIVTNNMKATGSLATTSTSDVTCGALIPIIKRHVRFKKCIFINFNE